MWGVLWCRRELRGFEGRGRWRVFWGMFWNREWVILFGFRGCVRRCGDGWGLRIETVLGVVLVLVAGGCIGRGRAALGRCRWSCGERVVF